MQSFASASLSGSNESDLFEHLNKVISSKWFLDKQGLNNEIPFFICPFKPQYQVQMDKLITQLINKLLNAKYSGRRSEMIDPTLQ